MDVVDLRTFYNQPLGQLARRLVGDEIGHGMGSVSGQRIAGIGFATPYLRPFLGRAERVFAMMPARQGVLHWPPEGPFVSALVDECALPLPDSSVDLVIAVHALEMSLSPEEHLSEIRRVLVPGGRLVLVVPNRRGLWARFDNTPFGHGRPYSRGQVSRLLQDALMTPESSSETLYTPPIGRASVMRSANFFERAGRSFSMPVGGILVVVASKQIYQQVEAKKKSRFAVRIAPVLVPKPATRISAAIRTLPATRRD
ncbi:MAG: methyltransferase domain-containing protein [Rhodobiaceae bacterium]|nr:methyltransferase domain-containing protein [Rhodobiaceae bacterium]